MPDATPPNPPQPPNNDGSGLPPRLLAKLKVEIEGYELIDRLGEGGQATVYKAIQKKDGQTVAVKVLHAGPHATEEARARLKREINALRAINHPNIVQAIAAGRTRSGLDCLVMNFIDGRPLDDLWNDPAFAATIAPQSADVLRLFKTICETVQAAHRKGITHRDLSPSNILIDASGQPHILDFGMASTAFDGIVTRDISMTGQFIGKLQYASPEQASGVRMPGPTGEAASTGVDIRSDVYALGVMLYQLLTGGAFPYEVVGNVIDVLHNIIHSKPRPPREAAADLRTPTVAMVVPAITANQRHAATLAKPAAPIRRNPPLVNETIEAIVLKALEKDPAQRYQSAGELATDIDRYLAGQPTSAVVWSRRPGSSPTSRPFRRAAIVAGSVVLVATLAGVSMNAKTLAVWLGVATAAAPTLPTDLAPSTAEAAMMEAGFADDNPERLNDFAAELARVEARLHAVHVRLAEVTSRKPPELDSNLAGESRPLTADAFAAALAKVSSTTGRDLTFTSLAKPDRDREEQAEADQLANERDENALLRRRARLDAEQSVLWSQLAWGTFTGREQSTLYRYALKSAIGAEANVASMTKFLEAGVKVRRWADEAMSTGSASMRTMMQGNAIDTAGLASTMITVADQLRASLQGFEDPALALRENGNLPADQAAALMELQNLAVTLRSSLNGCVDAQSKIDKAADEQGRVTARGELQRKLLSASTAASQFDARLVAFFTASKLQLDMESKLRPINPDRPRKAPVTDPNKDNSVTTFFVVGKTLELDGVGVVEVKSVTGDEIVLVTNTPGAAVRTLRLRSQQNEIVLLSDSGITQTIAPNGLNIRGKVMSGTLNLSGTRTILITGQPVVENVTYVIMQRPAPRVVVVNDDALSAWRVGSLWLNVAATDAKDDTWEVTGRSANTIEVRRKANRGDRDIIVTFTITQNRTLAVTSLRYSSGVSVLKYGGSGAITPARLTASMTWTTKGRGRKPNWNGDEKLDLRPAK